MSFFCGGRHKVKTLGVFFIVFMVFPDIEHKFILLNLSFLKDNFEEGLTDFLLKICIKESDNSSVEKNTNQRKHPFKGIVELWKKYGHP